MKLSLWIILSIVLLLQIVHAGRYGYAGRGGGKGKGGGGGGAYRYNPNAQQQRYRGGAGGGGGSGGQNVLERERVIDEQPVHEQINKVDSEQEPKLVEEKKQEEAPKFCLISSGFLAPINTGAPLGLRVKRDTDLPPERGLFIVIAIDNESPSATTLHMGDTITMVNGYSTKDMSVAQFSQAITEARKSGAGYVSMTFYTKHCPPPPTKADLPQTSSSSSQASDMNKEDLSTLQQKSEETVAAKESTSQNTQNKYEEEDEDEDEDEEGEEEEEEDDEDDDEDFENGKLYGEYSVVLQNFQPPLGLRVTQEGKHLVVVGVIAKPEIWTMVKVGDILSAIQNERPRTTAELKETVLSQAGKDQVTVKLLRHIPKAVNKNGQGWKVDQQQKEREEGPRLSIVLKHDRTKPLGLRLASLASTGTADDGFLGVVDSKGHEFIQAGDRLRFVGGLLVMTPLDVSDALRADQDDKDDELIELEFIRGVPGTLEDLRLLKKSSTEANTKTTLTTTANNVEKGNSQEMDTANPVVSDTAAAVGDRKSDKKTDTGEDTSSQVQGSIDEDSTKKSTSNEEKDDEEEYTEDDDDGGGEEYDEEEDEQEEAMNDDKDSAPHTKPLNPLKDDKESKNIDDTKNNKKEENANASKPQQKDDSNGEQQQQKQHLKSEVADREQSLKKQSNEEAQTSDDHHEAETEMIDPEEEAARLEILRQVKEAEEIKAKADAALKELERKRQEERERRALLKKKQEEEEAERRRKEQEEKERQQMCAAEAVVQQQKLEETIYQVLKDDNFLRAIAKMVAARAYQQQ